MSTEQTLDDSGTEVNIKIPLRCLSCDEFIQTVETKVRARDLPSCPHCGEPHCGGEVADVEAEVLARLVNDAEQIFGEDGTPAQVLDHLMTQVVGVDVEDWAEVRGVGTSSINRRISGAEEKIHE